MTKPPPGDPMTDASASALPQRATHQNTSAAENAPQSPGAKGPLDGLRVLELGASRAGAFAGAMLADLGADVIKVEDLRLESTSPGPVDWRGIDRLAFDRNKRSVGVDLGRPGTGELLSRLLSWSEVLLEDCGPELLSHWGLDAAALQEQHPTLVHCSITAFGPLPTAATPAVTASSAELLVQALSGNMDLTGEAGGAPFELGIPLCDLGSGVYAVIGILGAVVGGQGARVEVAKLDVAVALLSYMAVGYFADGEAPTRVGTGHSTIFPYNSFRALDGEVVVAPFTQRFWRNFCTATDREDLTQVDTYKDFKSRLRHKEALLKMFEPILAQKTVAEWVEIFRLADVPSGPVLTVQGALNLPQTMERGMTPQLSPTSTGAPAPDVAGALQTSGSPFRFLFSDGGAFTPAMHRPPALGEHTDSVLSLLGPTPATPVAAAHQER